jgi:hypothetical protein
VVNDRVARLARAFPRYVSAYDQRVPFTGEQLAFHRETIDRRRQAGSTRAAVSDPRFVTSLRRTLLAWGIGRRAAKLVSDAEFVEALNSVVPMLEPLESLRIDAPDLPANLADQLCQLVMSLGVVENKAKLVAGTKTLHHLLPDLVVPMDRAWTGKFFQLHLREWQDPASQRRIFHLAYGHFMHVARQVQPEQYVTGQGWRTSRTKILDNALIGFCKLELGNHPAVATAVAQLSFDVPGHPPSKNEAKSLLSAGHGQANRVRLLLLAAQRACAEQAFVPINEGGLALDVVVRAPIPPPGDATNYLGGVADVLQDKAGCTLSLHHLGDLAAVRLYSNDRQIRQVSYREQVANEAGYTVTVRSLSDHESPTGMDGGASAEQEAATARNNLP